MMRYSTEFKASTGQKVIVSLIEPRPRRSRRNHELKIRMNDTEFAAAKQAAEAAGLSMAEVIRMSVGKVRTWTLEDREGLRMVALELAKIGNNLNQIARQANRNGFVDLQILTLLEQIQAELKEVTKTKKEK